MLFVSWQLFVKLRVMWNSTENHAIESYFSSNTWQTISYSYVHITVCDKYQVPWKRVLFSQRQHLNIWQSLDQGTVCASKRKYEKVTNLIQDSKGGTFQTNQSKSFHLHQSNLTWAQMRTLIHFWLSLKVEIQLLHCYPQWQTCNQVGNLWQTCTPVWTVTDGPKHCKFTSQQATPMCLWIWPVTQSQPLKMQNISQTHRRSQQSVHTILPSLVFNFVKITYFVINSSWWEKLQKQWLCLKAFL